MRGLSSRYFFGDKTALAAFMSGSAKVLPEGLEDLECNWGNIVNRHLIPYVQPAYLKENQETTKINIELPDGTNYQIV